MSQMQRARLIPVSGIGSAKEAEQRATSALLAVISIVREFSEGLTAPLGASKAKRAIVETFTEVEVKLPDGSKVRPDGLIRVTYGSSVWTSLVEVKTGDSTLAADQINNYLTAAREVDANTVVTISNEIGIAGSHPTPGLKVRSNSRVKVHHFSWTQITALAVQNKVHAGVADPEQAWILGELIRYLEHPASGAAQVADMGPAWVAVRDGVRERSLRKTDDGAADIASRWDQLIQQAALNLSSETGADVTQVLSRKQQDPAARVGALCETLADTGQLSGVLRIPDTAGDLEVTGDLRARQIITQTTIDAPKDKKGKGSITWLSRQLDAAPASTVIDAYAAHARTPISAALAQVREEPGVLLADGQKDVSKFVISQRREAGQNGRSGGRKPGFIDTVNTSITGFYTTVLQQITPWIPPAPKVSRPPRVDTAPQPDSPDLDLDTPGTLAATRSPESPTRWSAASQPQETTDE